MKVFNIAVNSNFLGQRCQLYESKSFWRFCVAINFFLFWNFLQTLKPCGMERQRPYILNLALFQNTLTHPANMHLHIFACFCVTRVKTFLTYIVFPALIIIAFLCFSHGKRDSTMVSTVTYEILNGK